MYPILRRPQKYEKFCHFIWFKKSWVIFFQIFVAFSEYMNKKSWVIFFKIFRSTQNIWTLLYRNIKSYELCYGFSPLSSISLTLNLWTSLWKTVWLNNWSNRQMSDNFLPRAERSNFKPAKAIKEDTNQHATFFPWHSTDPSKGEVPFIVDNIYCKTLILKSNGLTINYVGTFSKILHSEFKNIFDFFKRFTNIFSQKTTKFDKITFFFTL